MTSNNRGFSLLEMAIVVCIIFIVVALAVPTLMTQVRAIRIQYSATDLSGLLQRARIEAVRKNSFYSIQNVAGAPAMEQVVDKNQAVVTTIPPAQMGQSVNVFFGTGSGAPNEAAFVTGLNYAVAAAAAGLPSFNARGLPCINTGAATCTRVVGQGYVFFLSGTSAGSGNLGWGAVAVSPSGRVTVWSYTGTTWIQR
jgi:type II secretory pathway pseudopilin PulG